MNNHETVKLFALMAIEWPNQTNDDLRIDLWSSVLADVPYGSAQDALMCWLRDPEKGKYAPRPGELRALAIEATSGLPTSGEAWGEVMREIRRVGSSGRPEFSCGAIEKAVRAMGWRELCCSEQLSVERAHFFRVFDAYRSRALRDEPFPGALPQGIENLGELLAGRRSA